MYTCIMIVLEGNCKNMDPNCWPFRGMTFRNITLSNRLSKLNSVHIVVHTIDSRISTKNKFLSIYIDGVSHKS